ncbi:hypothetical protein Nepgr_031741 [Nepenthes gracilis]|uniref:Uncharacterized protein n=1 Tax=Nepenthes gracilis TaxID=150966 RepID=A0AAD3THA8_NEPGR|nr:hypothetical protein Nepgr_031741 [Nepenthes gracilis]
MHLRPLAFLAPRVLVPVRCVGCISFPTQKSSLPGGGFSRVVLFWSPTWCAGVLFLHEVAVVVFACFEGGNWVELPPGLYALSCSSDSLSSPRIVSSSGGVGPGLCGRELSRMALEVLVHRCRLAALIVVVGFVKMNLLLNSRNSSRLDASCWVMGGGRAADAYCLLVFLTFSTEMHNFYLGYEVVHVFFLTGM